MTTHKKRKRKYSEKMWAIQLPGQRGFMFKMHGTRKEALNYLGNDMPRYEVIRVKVEQI